MIRKTAHTFPKLFKGNYGQVRDFIVLESTWLGYHEPHSDREISSFHLTNDVGNGSAGNGERIQLNAF